MKNKRRDVISIVQTAVYDKENKNSQYLAWEQLRLTFISINRFFIIHYAQLYGCPGIDNAVR